MSQCRFCNSPSFTLDRTTGVLHCSNCGRQNYVGTPSYYEEGIALVPAKKTNKPDEAIHDSYVGNSIFKEPK